MRHALLPALIASLCPALFASVRDDLSLLIDLSPTDTVAKVRSAGDSALELELRTPSGPRRRNLSVSSAMRERIAAAARAEGLYDSTAPAPRSTARIGDDQQRNRTMFNRAQGAMGAGVFYWTVGFGLQPNSASTATGLILLGYPASYLGHFLYGRDREWTDAHLAGTNYGSTSIYATTLLALPFLTSPDKEESWRAATFVSAAAYPLGIHVGYWYGARRRDDPGRVYLAQSLANQGAFTGALAIPTLLADHDMGEDNARAMMRLAALSAIGGEIGGHVFAERMMPGQTVPGGLGLGISTLANLGLASSVELILDPESDISPRMFFGALLAGNTVGTAMALKVLPERRDTRERSIYISAGTSLGILGGLGLMLLANPKDATPREVYAWPLLGAWAGYGITTFVTGEMVEPPAGRRTRTPHGILGDVAFSPLVVPVPTERSTRWVWPGMTLSLR